jgi:TatA/E family protein of Tat protein translocase
MMTPIVASKIVAMTNVEIKLRRHDCGAALSMAQCEFLFAFLSPSPSEMLLVMLVALLLYGGELPKVARSWGKALAEFKRGFSGIQKEFNQVFHDEPRRIPYHDPVYSHDSGTADSHDAGTVEGELAGVTSAEEVSAVIHPAKIHDDEPFTETFLKQSEQSSEPQSSSETA